MSLTDNVFIVTLRQECTQLIRMNRSFTFYVVNCYLVIYNFLYSFSGRTIILLCFFKDFIQIFFCYRWLFYNRRFNNYSIIYYRVRFN